MIPGTTMRSPALALVGLEGVVLPPPPPEPGVVAGTTTTLVRVVGEVGTPVAVMMLASEDKREGAVMVLLE
jgi:ABC-type molybdate transport system permease subunit